MQQLSGLDAMFVHLEQHGLPMHISSFTAYDPSTSPTGKLDFANVERVFNGKFLDEPILRSKLQQVPFNLDQPYWVEDQNFELNYHLRHVALPEPRDSAALCRLLSDLHAQPLDRTRPLWEAYIIEGVDKACALPEGSFGLFLKVHHSIMDGQMGLTIFSNLHTADPAHLPPRGKREAEEEAPPSQWQLLRNAYRNNTKRYTQFLGMVGRAVPVYRKLRQGFEEGRIHRYENKPRIRFNAPVSAQRIVDRYRMSLPELKQIKKLVPGATINDVALTIIGGAMRSYLLAKHELPESSLVATAPVNIRPPGDDHSQRNYLNVMNVALRTDIEDPLERLKAVHAESQSAKAFTEALGATTLTDGMQCLYAGLLAWVGKEMTDNALTSLLPPPNHTVVTNVAGVPCSIYLAGARLVDSFGLGPLLPMTGLFHTVSSTEDHLSISFVACPHLLPDYSTYTAAIARTFKQLRTLTEAVQVPPNEAKAQAEPTQNAEQVKVPTKKPAAKAKARTASAKKTKGNIVALRPQDVEKKPAQVKPEAKRAS